MAVDELGCSHTNAGVVTIQVTQHRHGSVTSTWTDAMRLHGFFDFVLVACLAGCGGDPDPGPTGCTANADCAGTPDTPLCEAGTGACVELPPGHEIGWGDGSPGSVSLVPVFEPEQQLQPTDLAFNTAKPTELWVVNRLDNSVIIIENPGEPEATWEHRRDPDAGHFMDRPPALAFGAESSQWGMTWATCGDSDN